MRSHFLISLRRSAMRISSIRFPVRFRDDVGAALISVMLFIILLGGLSLVLLATLLGQMAPSFTAQQNTQTGYAAQAGLQAGLGAIRSAAGAPVRGVVYGDPSRLPCGFVGNVDGTATSIAYNVSIRYYTADPTNQSETWREANRFPCTTPGGLGLRGAPRFALLVSQAVSPAGANVVIGEGQRTISAVYAFKVTNINIPGGRIWDFNGEYCMHAETGVVGSEIGFRSAASCATRDFQKMWIYDTDYRIKLASTTVAGAGPALCMTDPVVGNQRMTLQVCLPPADPARWNQLWNLFAGPVWYGQRNPIAAGRSGICISSGHSNGTNLVAVGARVLARPGCIGSQRPEAQVGAGAASKATNQIVSYSEFGRCADVTEENLTRPFMIVYPCKQDARGGGIGILWNHKWFYDEPVAPDTEVLDQEIVVLLNDIPANRHCLETPLDTSGSTYVTFSVCNSTVRQDWDRVQDSGNYDTSYLFIDKYGRCLTANADPTDLYAGAFSKMTVSACNGTLAQKWNAPPGTTNATFGGYREFGG